MAGDWIKVEITTPDKPEEFEMAEMLHLSPDEVLGKLIRVWIWADQHTRDGNAPSVTKALLDRYAAVTGFAAAMISVGWLLESGGRIQFSHFDRHNGKTAKTRALGAKRTQSHRSGNASVTQPPLQDRDSGVTDSLPEKRERREEKREDTQTQAAKPRRVFVKPTAAEVSEYAASIGSNIDGAEFCDFYESKGWKIGREAMKDWRATVRNWEARRKSERQATNEQRAERAGFTAQARQDAQWDVFRDFSEAAARDDARDRQRIAASGEGGSTQHRLSDHATLFGEESGTNDAV